MASSFVRDIQEHRLHIQKLEEEGSTFRWAMFEDMGFLKPFTVRLPSPMLAVLDELQKYGPWRSKQEMVFKMIESAYYEFYESAPADVKKRFAASMDKEIAKFNQRKKAKKIDHGS